MRRAPLAPALLGAIAVVTAASSCGQGASASKWCASIGEAVTSCPGSTTVKGVDVSHYDGTIDWATAHGAGIDFAFAKATESTSFTDPTFATNWAAMKKAGVVRGAYHFFHADVDPAAQMTYFAQAIQAAGGLEPGDLPPAIDFEVTNNVAASTIEQHLLTAIDALAKATGMKPIVYTSPSFANPIMPAGTGSTSTLWVANWQVSCPNLPSAWTSWSFWQSADNGTVAGISAGSVDLDEFDGSLAQLQAFGGTPGGDAGASSGGGDAGGSGSSSGAGSGSSSGGGSDGGAGSSGGVDAGGGKPGAGGGDAGTGSGGGTPCGNGA
jgi:lysozyme